MAHAAFLIRSLMSCYVLLGGLLLLPSCGFWLDCFASVMLRLPAADVAAIAIETGVQKSGITTMLLKLSFPEPDGDIGFVVTVVASIFTPGPLLLGYLLLSTPFELRLFPKTYNPTHETIQYSPLNSDDTMFASWVITCLNTALMNRTCNIGSSTSDDPNFLYVPMLPLVENKPIRRPAARKILHICYHRWPDGEIPQAPAWDPSNYEGGAEGLVELLREELGMVEGRVCVHCHAGIGRTGVAVAPDIAANRLLDTHAADVRDPLRRIRTQRPKSVVNDSQYAHMNLTLSCFDLSAARLAQSPPRPDAFPPLTQFSRLDALALRP